MVATTKCPRRCYEHRRGLPANLRWRSTDLAEATEYRCDGCGRTLSTCDLFAPRDWYSVRGGARFLEEGHGFKSWHACSPLCLGMVSRRHEHEVLMEAM